MTRMKLSSQDKKDLDKFTKFWALKSTQVIVQSRLGEKASTVCKPQSSGTDWVSFKKHWFAMVVLYKQCYWLDFLRNVHWTSVQSIEDLI